VSGRRAVRDALQALVDACYPVEDHSRVSRDPDAVVIASVALGPDDGVYPVLHKHLEALSAAVRHAENVLVGDV
jgi:hypothetical protein